MLESRIITSVVLALLVFTALLSLPPPGLTPVLAALLLGVGGWESSTLAGLNRVAFRCLWIAVLLLLGALSIGLLHQPESAKWVFLVGAGLWLVLPFWLARPSLGRSPDPTRTEPAKLALQALILVGAFAALAWLHVASPWWVIWLLLVVAGADVGAYFAGSALGGPKLAPAISPGKTWSGAVGGLLAALLVGIAATGLPDVSIGRVAAAGLALLLAVLSVFGDLTFSLLKRQRGLKDTSALLPGHGGLLDRVDGLVAAAPACALILGWTVE